MKCGYKREDEATANTRPKFGLIRSTLLGAVSNTYTQTPSDLRIYSPVRHNQLQTSSCVANSSTRALEIEQIASITKQYLGLGYSQLDAIAKAKTAYTPLSRLAMYYIARELMSPPQTNNDDGTMVSLAAEVVRQFGVCAETIWPFDESKVNVSPTWTAMQQAYLQRIVGWYRIETTGNDRVNDVILALASGKTVVYGTKIDATWETYDGSRPLDIPNGKIIGGHATVIEGWDPSRSLFLCENSWDTTWGARGPDGTGGFYEIAAEVIADDAISSDFVVYDQGWSSWPTVA